MKKFLSALLAISVVLGGAAPTAVKPQDYVISASAAEEYTEGTYDVLKYKNYGDYIEISDCDEAADEVVIPSEIDGVPVTSIGDEAFQECTRLTSITIPDSVISIGISAFKGCLNLTEILVDKNNQYYVSINGVLFNKDKTEFYAYPKMKTEKKYCIPDSVTSIADGAFYGCSNLSSITIPNGVKSIEDWAFIGCSGLKSIFIPNSVESIGKNTFLGFHGTI